jgi:uncharacterized membrane protein YkvA (DUF1232 family)
LALLAGVKEWARRLKCDVVALWLGARDPRVPWHAKALAGAVAAYALSPIDLIPDFVPVLGYVDDLLIVPAGIWLAIRLIPAPVMAELRAEAAARPDRLRSLSGLIAVLASWTILAIVVGWFAWRRLHR